MFWSSELEQRVGQQPSISLPQAIALLCLKKMQPAVSNPVVAAWRPRFSSGFRFRWNQRWSR